MELLKAIYQETQEDRDVHRESSPVPDLYAAMSDIQLQDLSLVSCPWQQGEASP